MLFSPVDTLHRLVKATIDRGLASSIEEAEALFRGYRLCLAIGEGEARHHAHQGALLTAVALARRVFLGGVTVAGPLDVPLAVPLALGTSLRTAVECLGGQHVNGPDDGPRIYMGGSPRAVDPGFRVRAVYSGWRGGVIPAANEFAGGEEHVMPLAPMLAAGLAVSEAFCHVQGATPTAGRRSVGLSLWDPARIDWFVPDEAPRLCYLPSKLWLIGLGHLGQAYLWALGLLPYPQPSGLSLTLQDVDVVTPSTESTSILTDKSMVGMKKTRSVAAWAEARGFTTAIVERLFDVGFRRTDDDPPIALCGLDNALGRRALDQVGFPMVVEAGLGRGYADFRSIRVHTLPGSRKAADIWKANNPAQVLTDRAAYQRMLRDGDLDRCGITLLAGKAVGAPFVGAVAACLVVGELLRFLHGGQLNELVDLDLQSIEHRSVLPRALNFERFNPGYVGAHTSRPAAP